MQKFTFSIQKISFVSAMLLTSLFLFSGCLEQETTGDTTQRELDRQKEAAAALQPGQEFFGRYIGENADYGRIDVLFRQAKRPQSGSIDAPQLSIVGRFIFVRRSADPQMKGAPDEAFTTNDIPFNNGQFDPTTGTVAIEIGADNPVVVNCDLESTADLHCVWIGSHGKEGYQEFDLKKVN